MDVVRNRAAFQFVRILLFHYVVKNVSQMKIQKCLTLLGDELYSFVSCWSLFFNVDCDISTAILQSTCKVTPS